MSDSLEIPSFISGQRYLNKRRKHNLNFLNGNNCIIDVADNLFFDCYENKNKKLLI
jgi:hypothetical protein